MPEPRDLHVDALLTDLSVRYRNEQMVWPQLLPVVRVNKRSNKFTVYNKEDSFRLVSDVIGPKSLPNEVTWGVTTQNYSVSDHALGDWLPQESIDNASAAIRPEVDTNDFLNSLLDIAQERRVADLVFTPATYPATNRVVLSGAAQWNVEGSDPLADLLTAIETCFVRANTVIMGSEVWNVVRRHPRILDAVKGSTRTQATPGGLATIAECQGLFEVQNWLVGRARHITTREGQAPIYDRLWGRHCAALHVEGSPGVNSITFGVTFCEMLRQTQRDFDPKRGVKGAHYIKVAWNSDERVLASDLGYLIQSAIA